MNTIQEALDDLGDDVAGRLIELGIKGKKHQRFNCPIANYLKRLGFNGVEVGISEIDYCRAPHRTPVNVQHFIEKFDGGEYPELVE